MTKPQNIVSEITQWNKRLARYYPNGDRIIFYTKTPEFIEHYGTIEHWQEYNESNRFGCALFIDSECVYKGLSFSAEKLAEITMKEREAMTNDSTTKSSSGC